MSEGKEDLRQRCKTQWTLLILLTCLEFTCAEHCPRDRSRVIRNAINEALLPIYEAHQVVMPPSCPLAVERDIYADNEANKIQENLSRWVCQYCGKAFFEERFLDVHLDNKHKETFENRDNKVCLSDYCDIFRCDVLGNTSPPDYWDIAMCKNEDLKQLQYKCQKLMRTCIPSKLSGEAVPLFNDKLNKALCSFLNCKDYWQQPPAQNTQISIATYVICGMMLCFGMMIYYYVAYIHFYTEEQVFESNTKYDRSRGQGDYGPIAREVRRRGIQSQQPKTWRS